MPGKNKNRPNPQTGVGGMSGIVTRADLEEAARNVARDYFAEKDAQSLARQEGWSGEFMARRALEIQDESFFQEILDTRVAQIKSDPAWTPALTKELLKLKKYPVHIAAIVVKKIR